MTNIANLDKINTPENLLDFLDKNMTYGVIDSKGIKHYDNTSDNFQSACLEWRVRSIKTILKDGVGHCYDYVEVERYWFEKHNYNYITLWINIYDTGDRSVGFCHTYLIFFDKKSNEWVYFEASDSSIKGLHRYPTIKDAIVSQQNHQIDVAKHISTPKGEYNTEIFEYSKPIENITYNKYINHVKKQPYKI